MESEVKVMQFLLLLVSAIILGIFVYTVNNPPIDLSDCELRKNPRIISTSEVLSKRINPDDSISIKFETTQGYYIPALRRVITHHNLVLKMENIEITKNNYLLNQIESEDFMKSLDFLFAKHCSFYYWHTTFNGTSIKPKKRTHHYFINLKTCTERLENSNRKVRREHNFGHLPTVRFHPYQAKCIVSCEEVTN